MKKRISKKQLIKKVEYLLSEVNISLSLLKELSKRNIYKLLKKAKKINTKFDFSKKELKEFSKFIFEGNEKVSKDVKMMEKALQISTEETFDERETYELPMNSVPRVYSFINSEEIMIC